MNLGRKHSEETKRKVAIAGMGRQLTVESKAKIGAANSRKDLWPHPGGNTCNCRECLDKKNKRRKDLRVLGYATKKYEIFKLDEGSILWD